MNYTGIDYHKRYSVACTLDAQGRKLQGRSPTGSACYMLAVPPASLRDDWLTRNRQTLFARRAVKVLFAALFAPAGLNAFFAQERPIVATTRRCAADVRRTAGITRSAR